MKKLLSDFIEHFYSIFGKPGEMVPPGLTFDDVLLKPKFSRLRPDNEIVTSVRVCGNLWLNTPFISAAMDTVTESKMGITMARHGALGIVHRNCTVEKQCAEVFQVKRHQGDRVTHPIVLGIQATISDALDIKAKFGFTTIPIVDMDNKLLGLITQRHIDDYGKELKVLLTTIMVPLADLTVGDENTDMTIAMQLMKEKGGKKRLPYVDSETGVLLGIYFKKDIQDKEKYPNMAVDSKGRLLVGAAIGVGDEGFARAEALIKAGADILCIDTAQGDSIGVVEIIQRIKEKFPDMPIMAGNVVTESGAERLIKAGADAIKVGVGPGAICTTRETTGNGMPQFSAILEVARATKKAGIPLIADGGIKSPGDVVKALAAGASAVMMGSAFSGTDEAPGAILEKGTARYKVYRGMGSVEAMHETNGIGNDRYGLNSGIIKKVPEGVTSMVPYKGPVQDAINKYLDALIQSMRVYQGVTNIAELQKDPKFVHQTQLGKIESGTRVEVIL
jgi:IMP dehydrogenase